MYLELEIFWSQITLAHEPMNLGVHAVIRVWHGTGKPVGFPKWVVQVWVWYWISAHHGIPHTRTTVSH